MGKREERMRVMERTEAAEGTAEGWVKEGRNRKRRRGKKERENAEWRMAKERKR